MTENYLNFLGKVKRRTSLIEYVFTPPKKKVKFNKDVEDKIKNKKTKHKFKKENEIKIIRFNSQYKVKDKKEKIDKNAFKDSKISLLKDKNKVYANELFFTNVSKTKDKKKLKKTKPGLKIKQTEDPDNISVDKAFNINPKDVKFFKVYLNTPLGELAFDDAIVEDKRKFTKCFCQILKERQMIAYTFIAQDPLKTRCTKIMLLCLNIIIYFVINGLFFNEEYISEIFNSTDENFFSFFPRSLSKFFFCALFSEIISYITDMFFLEEKKIVGIYKREKDNKAILKKQIKEIIKDIKKRYLAFIIVVFVIILISFYYLLCFNYVYPHTQIEWVKSSITILFIMQILSILSCLLESGLRIGSFKCNSEKMYKISKLLS